jgi:hypothetical protein
MASYISSMKMRLSHATLALALIAGPAIADDAPVKPSVVLDYKIYIGGLEALSATVSIGEDAAHYDVAIKAVTAGAVGRMMPWTIDIDSRGNVAGDVLQPVEHAQKNSFQSKNRSVTLHYDGHGGFIERTVIPAAQEDQRDEVPADQTRNTLDIVSGVFAGLRAADRTGSCNGRVPVFDGRRRFDLLYSDDGHETLEASGVAMYSGDALKCSVKVEPGAGYWKKNQKKFFTRRVNGEDQVVPIEVYIARVGAAKVEVPVRIESTSPFGSLVLNLQSVHDPS